MTGARFDKLVEAGTASDACELKGLSDGDAKLRECIQSLLTNSVGKTQSQAFDDFCEQACVVFGKDFSDAQILSNCATPDIVRYLVNALYSFRGRSLTNAVPDKRARALAGSMMAVASKGAPAKAKQREGEIFARALASINLDFAQGYGRADAESRAVAAAYRVFREDGRFGEKRHDRTTARESARSNLRTFLLADRRVRDSLARFKTG